jgi:hypothetical protein
VSYATQIDEEHEDRNFETFPDGSRFTRTVDTARYTVKSDGAVVWRGVPVLRGPPTVVGELWHSCREYVPAFVANRNVRILHVSVPSYTERLAQKTVEDPKTGKRVTVHVPMLLYKGPKASDDVPVIYCVDWVKRNLSFAPGWDEPEIQEKILGYEGLGSQWGAYKFMWCLGVAYATACASRFEGPAADRGPVAIYVDRKSFDLTAAQMELLVHAVFGSFAGAHKLHTECARLGVPYQGVKTPVPKEGEQSTVLSYQIGWRSLVDLNPRPLSAWYTSGHAAPAAFGEPRAATLDELVASFGPLFPLPLNLVAREVQGQTTLFDDEVRLDMASKNMRGRESMHVFVKDMWATEARGESLNVEGDNLEKFLALIIIEMPEMSAQRFEQLLDRINRVNIDLKAKRKKRIIHITAPSQVWPKSRLARLGATPLDKTVADITSELARHATDCDTNRSQTEASAMNCAVKWADATKEKK